MSQNFDIASICRHQGEEPPLVGEKGLCNVFFSGCNLHCVYCQNHDISWGKTRTNSRYNTLDKIINRIEYVLEKTENIVGFVSPSHRIPQMLKIIEGLHARGLSPTIIYNTNSYDSISTIKRLNGAVDVYLPDFKYSSAPLGRELSGVKNYPSIALQAIKEMYFQMGSSLQTSASGLIERGMIVRHLVLPGQEANSSNVLQLLAEELSTNIHISLMSQYFPIDSISEGVLSRRVTPEEYQKVLDSFYSLGFHRGWIQSLDTTTDFRPNFHEEDAFE